MNIVEGENMKKNIGDLVIYGEDIATVMDIDESRVRIEFEEGNRLWVHPTDIHTPSNDALSAWDEGELPEEYCYPVLGGNSLPTVEYVVDTIMDTLSLLSNIEFCDFFRERHDILSPHLEDAYRELDTLKDKMKGLR